MSVVGFDVGSLRAVVAVARAGGVDVICNEISERATPSLVSFDSKRRYLGEAAKIQQMSNFRNTVACLNRFVGRSIAEPEVVGKEKKFWTCEMGEKDGEVAAVVNYRGEQQTFSATEVMGMFLGKLKTITQAETKGAVSDCVISVPVYYTEAQRRAMLDAAGIAGLNCLRLINDTTATALCYGLTKNDQFSEKARTVCFVDIGYSGTKVTIVAFTKGHLEIKGSAWDADLGGRDFDLLLADHFTSEISSKFNCDIRGNARGVLRLMTACEKIKKVLSGISSTKVELETESRDFPLVMTREVFEEMAIPLVSRVEACLHAALQSAGISVEGLDFVEIVGGSTRIPSIKQMISRVLGKEPSTTLNQDEAISRGCAFQCAIESPSFRVREFGIKDIIAYPISLSWTAPEGPRQVEVFPTGSNLPSVKPLFLAPVLPVQLTASYAASVQLSAGVSAEVASFTVSHSKAVPETAKIRVDVAVNGHGLVCVKKALLVEERLVEEPSGPEPGAPKTTKKVIHESEISVASKSASRPSAVLQKLKDSEFALALHDKYAQELDDSRNSLEEYIYEMRSKLEEAYKPFVLPADSEALSARLAEAEDWLYSEHESENKEMYVAKLAELTKIGNPIAIRAREHADRPHAEALLRQLIQTISDKTASLDFEAADSTKLQAELASKLAWIDAEIAKQAALPLHADPKLTTTKINEQREKLLATASVILAKAKPKQEPKPEEESAAPQQATTPEMEVD